MNPHERPLFTAAEAAALHTAGGDLEAVARVAAEAVEREVDARLAPLRALAEEWGAWAQSDLRDDKATGSHPGSYWRGRHDGTRDCADELRAALDAASADLTASQDHDGTEGQGEGERAGDGDTCAHEWLDRPESDTRECLICGVDG